MSMSINDFKPNPDDITSIDGIDISEGCPPSNTNDAIRHDMSDLHDLMNKTDATQVTSGWMSSADKLKLDNIEKATQLPKANGDAAIGISTKYAAEDHVHPLQTTITGNAGTATKLATARTISLTGDVAGSVSFDGTDDVSIATTINKKISLVGTKLESLPNTRAEILPKNTDFTVPSYKVGSNTLMIFIDGIHCIAGSDADLYTYKEMGTVGTMSTTIQFHDDIAIDHSIFAIVFDLNI